MNVGDFTKLLTLGSFGKGFFLNIYYSMCKKQQRLL